MDSAVQQRILAIIRKLEEVESMLRSWHVQLDREQQHLINWRSELRKLAEEDDHLDD